MRAITDTHGEPVRRLCSTSVEVQYGALAYCVREHKTPLRRNTSCVRSDTIRLRPMQVDNIFAFIRQVAVLFRHNNIFVFIRPWHLL